MPYRSVLIIGIMVISFIFIICLMSITCLNYRNYFIMSNYLSPYLIFDDHIYVFLFYESMFMFYSI